MFTILGMMAFFPTYLQFEPVDLPWWGPLAADLAIVVSVGINKIYYSVDRGLLHRLWKHIMSNETENSDGGDEHKFETLLPNSRRRSSELSITAPGPSTGAITSV